MTFTRTQEQVQSTAQKAQDAYAAARQALEKCAGLSAQIETLMALKAMMEERIADMEDEVARLSALAASPRLPAEAVEPPVPPLAADPPPLGFCNSLVVPLVKRGPGRPRKVV